jgi:CRP/FNR family cyclic AMP-dependent transcriptional regulator
VKRVAIFKNMNERYTKLLQPLFQSYSCRSGKTVIQQGKPADYLYFIVAGKVEISFKPYDGTPITVSHIGKDGLFGWSALLGSPTYTSSVRATEDLETVRIRGAELRKLCIEQPEAGKEILEQIANVASSRWTNAHEQIKSMLLTGMQQ